MGWSTPGRLRSSLQTRRRAVRLAHRKGPRPTPACLRSTRQPASSLTTGATSAPGCTVSAYLTHCLNGVAAQQVRENTRPRYAACARLHVTPGLGPKWLARPTARDVRAFLDGFRGHLPVPRPRAGHGAAAVLAGQPVPQQAVLRADRDLCALGPQARPGTRGRESFLLRNVARNVKPSVLRPRRFRPFPVRSSAVAPRSQQ